MGLSPEDLRRQVEELAASGFGRIYTKQRSQEAKLLAEEHERAVERQAVRAEDLAKWDWVCQVMARRRQTAGVPLVEYDDLHQEGRVKLIDFFAKQGVPETEEEARILATAVRNHLSRYSSRVRPRKLGEVPRKKDATDA